MAQGARSTPSLRCPTGLRGIGGAWKWADLRPFRLVRGLSRIPNTALPCLDPSFASFSRAGQTLHLPVGACGAEGGHHNPTPTRCSSAPDSPLPSQHIPPALQNGRRPPASPSPSEPGVGSLAPICGSSDRVKSRRFFRALLAAPMLQPAAMLCWSGGRSEGRRWVDLCCALAWWPGAISRTK